MADSPKRHIIAVDPGDKNNGIAYFTQEGNGPTGSADLKFMQIEGPKGLSDLLKFIWGIFQAKETTDGYDKFRNNPHNLFFVIENFRVDTVSRGGRDSSRFQWNEMLTSQMIGRVRLLAEWLEAPVFMQEPSSVWPMARKWAPFPLPKGHPPDDKSAFCHGAKFMMDKGLINTVDQITFNGQDKMF